MSLYVQSTAAPVPKTKNTHLISIVLAVVFVVMAVAQLYSYEDFPDVVASFWLPGGHVSAALYAALLVIGEVLAIPFLLSMRLSPAMRITSMVAGWMVIVTWLHMTVLINLSGNAITNSGILGATIPLAPEWWMVCLFAALGVLSVWVSWGMWPIRRVK